MAGTMSVLLALVVLQIASAAAPSKDSVTVKYYGRYPDKFKKTGTWPNPHDVCHTFMSVCIDIHKNTCVPEPPEMRVPHTRIVTKNKASLHHIDPPIEGAGNTYMMTDETMFDGEHANKGVKLWSGCDEHCKNCHEGTGFALDNVVLPYQCSTTADGGVYALAYNKNDGTANTRRDCVTSLDAYYAEAKDDLDTKANVTWIIIGSVIALVVAGLLAFALRFGWKKRAEERKMQENLRNRTAEFRLPASAGQPSKVITQVTIEDRFPSTPCQTMDSQVCAVCLNGVELHDTTRKLQCNHSFHANCILSWWLHKPRQMLECPVCRQVQTMSDNETAPVPEQPVEPTPQGEKEGYEPQEIGASRC